MVKTFALVRTLAGALSELLSALVVMYCVKKKKTGGKNHPGCLLFLALLENMQ